MTSLLAFGFSACLLLARGASSLAAPALVLLLFAFPPSAPLDFLTSAPVAFAILVLALAALVDFCADLWRLRTAHREERSFLPSTLKGAGSVVEGLISLERSARWRIFRRRGEWLFVALWLAAAWWIHDEAALPLLAGVGLGSLLLLLFGALASWNVEPRERRIADGALRAAASLGLARLLGRFDTFAERSLARHASARRAERSLAILSATCLLCLRLSAAATLVLFLLYALSLVGKKQANLGELVAILLLLRTLFFWLEQRARALSFYAPQKQRGAFLPLAAMPQSLETQAEGSAEPIESASVPILTAEQGEVPSAAQTVLTCEGLVLQRGEAVVLAGESASGKSLLLQACAGQVESRGFFLSGKPVRAFAPSLPLSLSPSSSLRGVCYVPQEVCLLDGSLGENIASFAAPCDEARATELLVRLGAGRTLALLPDGLATRTQPFDASLPQAFKVQVLLAAALYSRPRLLLCDACIDALDGRGIERFVRVVQDFCKQEEGAAILVTRQSALLQVCRRAWICGNNKVRVKELETST